MNEWAPVLEQAKTIRLAEGDEAPVSLVFTDLNEIPSVGEDISLIANGVSLRVLSREVEGSGFKITVPAEPLIAALKQIGA